MKTIKMFIMISVVVCLLSACKSTNTTIKTDNKQVASPTKIITPTNISTVTPAPTSKPKLTKEEKANIVYKLGKEYKNNNSATLTRDEFDNSVSIVVPSSTSASYMNGDNSSERIKILAYIYLSGEEDSIPTLSFLFCCVHDSLMFPEKIYFKTTKNKIELNKLVNLDPTIEIGYVMESSSYEFKNNEEIMKMYNLLKSKNKIRIRVSGQNEDVDLTLNKQFKKHLLDGIDLYLKANKKLNN